MTEAKPSQAFRPAADFSNRIPIDNELRLIVAAGHRSGLL
jgi:hypothetical protein